MVQQDLLLLHAAPRPRARVVRVAQRDTQHGIPALVGRAATAPFMPHVFASSLTPGGGSPHPALYTRVPEGSHPESEDVVAQVAAGAAQARGRGRGRRGGAGRGRGRLAARMSTPDPEEGDGDLRRAVGEPTRSAPASTTTAARAPLPTFLPRLRDVDLASELEKRVYTFQSPPRLCRGLLRNAMRVALEAVRDGEEGVGACDGWALFLPRMLLFRAPASPVSRHHPASGFRRREHLFCTGQWLQLLRESADAAQDRREGTWSGSDAPEHSEADRRRRAERATALAHVGELSAAAKALTAPPLAPATQATLDALRDPCRRPQNPQTEQVPAGRRAGSG